MQYLNKLASKNLAKAIVTSGIAAGCVFGIMTSASAEGFISADAKKLDMDEGAVIWVAGKDKISVINTKQENYQAYDGSTVSGGVSEAASITGKTVDISGVTVDGDVFGCITSFSAEKNNVTIKNANVEGDVFGGSGENGVVSENRVTLTDTYVGQDVYGGNSESQAAKGNTVIITGGSVGSSDSVASVYGGNSEVTATGNSVSITGTKLTSGVYGGFSGGGSATDNKITLTDATFNFWGTVYGGCSKDISDANKNSIADNNTVAVNITKSNNTINTVYGGYGTVSAQNNKVLVNSNGSCEISTIAGGYAGENGNASNNLVVLKGIVTDNVYGGDGINTTTTNNNLVIIADSKVNVGVCGGNGEFSNDNTVVLVGKGGSYGCKSQDGQYQEIVDGFNEISIGEEIKGGQSGNLLAVYGTDTTVGNLAHIQKLEFTLVSGNNKDVDLLRINSENNDDTTLMNVEAVTISAASGAKLDAGAKVNLIHKIDSGLLTLLAGVEDNTSIFDAEGKVKTEYANIVAVSSPLQATSGAIALDKLDTDKLMNDLVFTAKEKISISDNIELADNAKNIVETRVNAAALVNEGADFILDQSLSSAKAVAKQGLSDGKRELSPFAAIGGGNMRYNTGSHVDSNSWHGVLGVSKQVGNLVYGIGLEHGRNNYDSYVNKAHGGGKSKATGGALFAEMKKNSGLHYDAALRVGRIKSDYSGELKLLGNRENIDYEESSTYYGFAVGGGKEVKLNDKNTVDFYGRYYWAYTGSSDVTTNLGDKLNFDGVNSHRTRIGSRYTHALADNSRLYAGLAWQYEFSCKAKATINGDIAPTPGLKGHSGMLELGWQAEASKNMTVELKTSAWTGKQRGITGGVNLEWKF